MTPQEVAIATALIELIRSIGSWPLAGLVMVGLIGPWLLAVLLTWIVDRSQSRRLSAAIDMYEQNVKLVERAETLAQNNEKLAETIRDLVLMNTRAMTQLTEAINQNQFCPLQRVEKRVEIHGAPK